MSDEISLSEKLDRSTARCLAMDAPLADRLASFARDVEKFSPAFAEIVERMITKLRRHGAGEATPAPGQPMPPFLLPDQSGRLVGLDKLVEAGPVVVVFLRGHWCPYCRINADAMQGLHQAVAAAGASIVAITPNLAAFNASLKGDVAAAYPILTDLDNGYALQLDLAFRVPDEKRQAMTAAGWDISVFQGSDIWMLPIPATFVVGLDGKVVERFVDPDYRKRMAVEDILAALDKVC
jgi:peroxiredoxin